MHSLRSAQPRHRLLNVVLVLLSVLICFVLAEIVLRLFVTLRDVGPSFTVHDPVLGKRVKASFSTERVTPEFRMRFTTNSLGFRGAEPRASSVRPILFLGDSFTLGYGVSDGEDYPALVGRALERRYGNAAPPVLNAGVGDAGNGFWIKFLRTRAESLQPALVAMQVIQSDFHDNVAEGLFALRPDGALEERPVPPPPLMRKLQPIIEAVPFLPESHLLGLVRQVRLPDFAPAPVATAAVADVLKPTDQLTLRILERAIQMCAEQGRAMLGILVGLPEARRAAVSALFARYGVRVVELPSRTDRPDLFYRIDGHWNAAGHAEAAQAIFQALEDLGIVKPAQQLEASAAGAS